MEDNVNEFDARRQAYSCADYCETCGDLTGMVTWLDRAGLAPGRDNDDYDFDAHRNWCHTFAESQRRAIDRGVPAIYLNALPNSASSFVSGFFANLLNVAGCRTSRGL